MLRTRLAVLAVTAAAALLVGCEQKFTRERFNMIEPQVDEKYDVEKILGEPEFKVDGEWYYENQDEHYAARIFFEGETVRAKEWMDARTGEWEGRHPDSDAPPEGEPSESRTRTRRVDP